MMFAVVWTSQPGRQGKPPSEIVMEALEQFGIERLSEDQFQKRMTGSQ